MAFSLIYHLPLTGRNETNISNVSSTSHQTGYWSHSPKSIWLPARQWYEDVICQSAGVMNPNSPICMYSISRQLYADGDVEIPSETASVSRSHPCYYSYKQYGRQLTAATNTYFSNNATNEPANLTGTEIVCFLISLRITDYLMLGIWRKRIYPGLCFIAWYRMYSLISDV